MIVAGFGFRTEATVESLHDAFDLAATIRPDALATLADKVHKLSGLAQALGLPVVAVSAENAAAQNTLTHSQASYNVRNTGSVAEACALAAAGPGAKLLANRIVSGDRLATCALAVRDDRE